MDKVWNTKKKISIGVTFIECVGEYEANHVLFTNDFLLLGFPNVTSLTFYSNLNSGILFDRFSQINKTNPLHLQIV